MRLNLRHLSRTCDGERLVTVIGSIAGLAETMTAMREEKTTALNCMMAVCKILIDRSIKRFARLSDKVF
jgi:hypothetical protein